jgi:hypothetical protein
LPEGDSNRESCHLNFEAFNKICRSVYTGCGFLSLAFLCVTLYLYTSLPKLRNAQVSISSISISTRVTRMGEFTPLGYYKSSPKI